MSDFFNENQDDELEAILNEVRGKSAEQEETSGSGKNWSADDIDRLIAESMGEEYIPPEPAADTIDERMKKLFGDEFDTGVFSVKPIEEEPELQEPEVTDISSGSEVEGQELFFEKSEPADDFDPELFSFETVFMPDSVPEATAPKYNTEEPKQEESTQASPAAEEQEKTEEEKVIDFRKRFFEKLNPEDIEIPNYDDKDPDYPFDKSGIVVVKNDAKTEDNLDTMPTVMAAEDARNIDEEKTKIMPIPGKTKVVEIPEPVDVEGQIILNDFVDIPEESRPEKAREEDVEEGLLKRRKQKAKTFVLDDLPDEDFSEELNNISEDLPLEDGEPEKAHEDEKPESIVDSVGEYTNPAERNKIHSKLAEKVKSATKSAIIVGAIDAVLVILAILSAFEFFETSLVILYVINALLLIGAAAIDGKKFTGIFNSALKGRFSADTAVLLSVVIALIENAVSAIFEGENMPVFGVIAVFAIFISKMTDVLNAKRIYDNFSVCAFGYENNINAVHKLDNESEVFELGRGLLMGNAEILYSSNTKFPSDFIKNSGKNDEDNKYSLYLIIGSLAASLISAVICALVNTNFTKLAAVQLGLSVFAAAVCLSAPVFGKFIPAFITFVTDKRLNKEGTVVTSIDAAEHIASSNAVVLDSADIFDRSACTMHGMKDFKSMRIDVVLLYAAAMVIKSGGPLKECFEQVIDGRQDLLPPVKELVYEDKMGISARIYDQKVLLGNRSMLVHHNIQAPEKAFEDKYIHDGRKVIYLACNEQLAAMFVVSYSVDENIKGYLRQLESSGIQILVRTNDVNVTEELISSKFGLSPDNFKILSSVAGRLYKRRKDAVIDELPAELVHDGESTSMLKAIASCCTMTKKNKFGTFIQIAAMVIGIIFAVLAGFGESGITAIVSVAIMLLEALLVTGILFLDKK